MAKNSQGGNGGPWGGGGGNDGPQGPWGGGGGGRGPQPPDIDELLRQSQEKIKSFLPQGAGSGRMITMLILVAIVIWSLTGMYRVEPGQQGVELLFGKFVKQTEPGLNFWLPAPIGEVYKPNVDRTNTIAVGFSGSADAARGTARRDIPQESLMLTGDQNIIDIDFVVQWRIKNAADYLFNIRDPQATIKIAAESAMREVVGQTDLEGALTNQRSQVEEGAKVLLQTILDDYQAGVFIAEVKLQQVDPPKEVIDSFNDVQRAKQDQERSINEAVTYRNDIVPKAKGQAEKMIQAGEAYREKVINEAEGEAARFISVLEAYQTNKEVTRRRMYLETMQAILMKSDKVIIDSGPNGGSGVVPYLPLPELKKRSGGTN